MSQSATPEEHRARVNGVEPAYFEWRPELRGRKPPILLGHATGFHARVWDQMLPDSRRDLRDQGDRLMRPA